MSFTEDELKHMLYNSMPGTAYNHMVRAWLYNIRRWPRCAGCGNTDNLTEVRATPEGTYHLCPRCEAGENEI